MKFKAFLFKIFTFLCSICFPPFQMINIHLLFKYYVCDSSLRLFMSFFGLPAWVAFSSPVHSLTFAIQPSCTSPYSLFSLISHLHSDLLTHLLLTSSKLSLLPAFTSPFSFFSAFSFLVFLFILFLLICSECVVLFCILFHFFQFFNYLKCFWYSISPLSYYLPYFLHLSISH